ncbi:MAG: bifunctional DNA-binding transcriptional regulator/O6-methylguanine-DNA methyltransferase Ada [Candidatus Acidiferrales bacterium]
MNSQARRREPREPGARQRWIAIQRRDAALDGAFVYAVQSTGIYCRPSCASRKPRREQVRFFAGPDAAERAGYRACRRCKPRHSVADPATAIVTRACRQIEANRDEGLHLSDLAKDAGMSPHQLGRAFQRVIGLTPRKYADAIRLGHLKRRLQEGDDVTTALYEAGYGSASRLYERSDAQLGMTPATYRKGGRGMQISFTVADCALGRVLVAATSKGISAIYLGESDAALERELRKEYSQAQISRHSGKHPEWVNAVVRHLAGRQPQLDLPTDVQATAFQRRVWEALRKIPYGATRTYGQIARSLGLERGMRAVARACATNPVSIVVPCHRVIRKDGGLGGYRWGLERKKSLIELEKRHRSIPAKS